MLFKIKNLILEKVYKIFNKFKKKSFNKDLYLEQINSYYNGKQYVYRFKNGYGASVIKNDVSKGSEKGLWELAVLKRDENDDWDLRYSTYITDDVIGYLSLKEVDKYLEKIYKLKSIYN